MRFSFLLCLFLVCTVFAAPEKLRVVFREDAGYGECTPDGTRRGFVVDWARRIAAEMGREVEWVDVPWGGMQKALESGQADLAALVLQPLAKRGNFHYTHASIGFCSLALHARVDSRFSTEDLGALDGCRVGVQRSNPIVSSLHDYLSAFGATCKIQSYPSIKEMLRAYSAGEVDVVLAETTEAFRYERRLFVLPSVPLHFAVPEGNPELADAVDAAVSTVNAKTPNFSHDLREKYFPHSTRTVLTFSPTEHAWITRNARDRKFSFDVYPRTFPSVMEESSGTADYAKCLLEEMADLTGLSLDVSPAGGETSMLAALAEGKVDAVLSLDPTKRENLDVPGGKSIPFMLPQAICTLRFSPVGFFTPGARAAVWKDDHCRLAHYTRLGFSPRLVVCETLADVIRSVLDGGADFFVCSHHVVWELLVRQGLRDRFDIRPLDVPGFIVQGSVLVSPRADPLFASVLGKAVSAFTNQRLLDCEYRAAANAYHLPFLTREQLVVVVLSVFMVPLSALIVVLFISRRRVRRALHKSNASLHVAEDALSEARGARRQMQDALARAEMSARSRANFLATMSHEIRTPLNAVVGFGEFLSEPDLPNGKVQEYARGVSYAANALLSLVNDVLDLTKFESGQTAGLDLRDGAVDVARLFKEMECVFEAKASARGITLAFRGADGIPRLRLAEPRLRQILLNLIGNAVKFTEKGGVDVFVAYEEKERSFVLRVADTGIGISAQGLKMIFEPFVQDMEGRGGKAFAGTGLGLSIVKRIAEASGGDLAVESSLGRGAVFTLRVPGVMRAEASEEEASEAEAVVPPRCVLIVDDIAMNRRILGIHCRTLGVAEVELCESGEEALARLAGGMRPDVVLTDLWMPGMDGSELARRIAVNWPEIPVVVVTADADAGATFDVAIFRDVLTKPVTAAKIREQFRKLRK